MRLKIDLPSIAADVEPVPLVESDEDGGVGKSLDLESAIKILSESTGNGYERVRKELKLKLPPEQTEGLKSLFLIKKDLPLKVESVTYQCKCIDENDNSKEEIEVLLYGLGAVVKNEEEAL